VPTSVFLGYCRKEELVGPVQVVEKTEAEGKQSILGPNNHNFFH
jgi:hypothetical protein